MDIDKLAHILSQCNMYGGDTPYPYSTAQAAVFRSYLAPKKLALTVLHSLDDMAGTLGPETTGPSEAVDAAAWKFERQILQGDHEAVIGGLPLGQYSYLREVVHALRQLHPKRARDLFIERHYELAGGAP